MRQKKNMFCVNARARTVTNPFHHSGTPVSQLIKLSLVCKLTVILVLWHSPLKCWNILMKKAAAELLMFVFYVAHDNNWPFFLQTNTFTEVLDLSIIIMHQTTTKNDELNTQYAFLAVLLLGSEIVKQQLVLVCTLNFNLRKWFTSGSIQIKSVRAPPSWSQSPTSSNSSVSLSPRF